jgi:hypothetical protein
MSTVSVVRVSDEIADALAVFFREAWGDAGTGDDVRRARAAAARDNPHGSGVDVPATAFLQDGRVIGYLSTIPVSFWNGSSQVAGHWLKGFMVLPEFRNGPVGFSVLKEMLRHLGVSGIMTVAPAARRLFTAVGYRDCGTLPNYIGLIRPSRVASRIDVGALGLGVPAKLLPMVRIAQQTGLAALGGAAIGTAIGVRRMARRPTDELRMDPSGHLPSRGDLDALWEQSRTTFVSAAVRDGIWLPWRYAPATGATYEAATIRHRDGTVRAVCIVRKPREVSDPRLRGIRVATLSDLLFPATDADAGHAAIVAAEALAHRMNADALACSASHEAITSLLARRTWVRLSGNVHLMIRDPKNATALAPDAGQWWVLRGDASSDEVF